MRYKMFGVKIRKEDGKIKYGKGMILLCVVEAESFDQAIEMARKIYGHLCVVGGQPV